MRRAGLAAAVALMLMPGAGLRAAGSGAGLLTEARTLLPETVQGTVVLFSDGGRGADDGARMAALRARGAAVIGVDSRALLARIEADPGACVYVMAQIEDLAKSLQRGAGEGSYRQPVLAGAGLGGALALALMAQTPPGTVAGALAVDPAPGLPLERPLCTQARREVTGGIARYGLSDTPLPAPIEVILTPPAPAAGRAHARELQAAHPDIVLTEAPGPAGPALFAALAGRLAAAEVEPLGLPLTLLAVPPTHDAMAVIWSGDGGWRDIDKQIGGALAARGVPVVGIDSLRYFWQERRPEEAAADLARIIATYAAQWQVKDVALIGYSFGADILPATFNHLPPEVQARVRQISLLGLSDHAGWEISVSGWLGQAADGPPTAPDLARIPPALLQCVYGEKEEASPCPALAAAGAEAIRTAGGHHFDGNYTALAEAVLARLDRRAGR